MYLFVRVIYTSSSYVLMMADVSKLSSIVNIHQWNLADVPYESKNIDLCLDRSNFILSSLITTYYAA